MSAPRSPSAESSAALASRRKPSTSRSRSRSTCQVRMASARASALAGRSSTWRAKHLAHRSESASGTDALRSLALGALIVAWRMVRTERYFSAFVASSAMIALLLFSGAIGMYPNLLISSVDAANNLTINNAASQENTLVVMLIITVIGLPFVLAYTAGVYYFFRGKTELTVESY